MGIREAIDVLTGGFTQFGLGGAQIRREGSTDNELSIRNADNSAFGALNVAAPTEDNHAANKIYVDSREGVIKMSDQADVSVSLPSNTAVKRYLVVTTAGGSADIGDILYDDGSSSGLMTVLPAEARTIFIPVPFSGGTQSFNGDSLYIWDEEGTQWLLVGDVGGLSGARRTIRYAITNAASQDSTEQIPAGNRVLNCRVEVTTPYSAGGTIEVGDTATSDKFFPQAEISPQEAGEYYKRQDTLQSAASVVRTTVGGTPAAGAGIVLVEYASPNN